jgi:uncharacterized protein YjiS (DUF1127 family)
MTQHTLSISNWINISWFRHKIAIYFANIERNKNIKHTMKELRSLSDKELQDIGLTRDDIWSVAHETHYDNRLLINKNLKGCI